MNKEAIDALVRDWLRARLDDDQIQRTNTDFAEDLAGQTGMSVGSAAAYLIGTDAEVQLEHWQKVLRDHDWEQAQPYARALIRELGLGIGDKSPEFRLLCQGIAMASAELHGIRAARSSGDWSDEATSRSLRLLGEPLSDRTAPAESSPREPLGPLIVAFLAEKRRLGGTDIKRMIDFEAALRLFEEWCGSSTAISTIDKRKIGEFRSILAKLPPNHTKRFRGQPLSEIIAISSSRGLPSLKPITINSKYLALLDAFFDWCRTAGKIEENPVTGVRLKVPKARSSTVVRGTFTLNHLEQIFGAPLYVGCAGEHSIYERGPTRIRDHRFWLPLLGLWTGARLNELCQLLVADVRKVEGVLCLDINDKDGKRLKTMAAERLVPVHPELIRIGFAAHVEECQRRGTTQLWPEIDMGAAGYRSNNASKWFARFLKLTIGDAEKRREKLAFHSFRHLMEDRLRAAGVDERVQHALIGHDDKHVSSRYGLGHRPPRLFEEITKVHHDGLNLSHLAAPRIAPS